MQQAACPEDKGIAVVWVLGTLKTDHPESPFTMWSYNKEKLLGRNKNQGRDSRDKEEKVQIQVIASNCIRKQAAVCVCVCVSSVY